MAVVTNPRSNVTDLDALEALASKRDMAYAEGDADLVRTAMRELINLRSIVNSRVELPPEVALVGSRLPTPDEIRRGQGLELMAQEVLARERPVAPDSAPSIRILDLDILNNRTVALECATKLACALAESSTVTMRETLADFTLELARRGFHFLQTGETDGEWQDG